MLTKSQARAFFIVGTGACAAVFLALTVDSFRQIPSRTHADQISPQVAKGKHLWESSNCMGCHTLFGEGAYYAPELTKVYERRGEVFIRAQLRDPEAMFPGQRKMQRYDFSEPDIDALIAFLKWAGTVDLNGFPAPPRLQVGVVPAVASSATLARPQVFSQVCSACHTLAGQGGLVGPALDDVGRRRDSEYLRRWLADPASVKPGSKMPKLPLTEAQLDELVTFLSNQKG